MSITSFRPSLAPRHLMMLAASGSALLLGGAYAFQVLGYAPCQMCLWQRWPHGAAILIGLLIWALRAGHGTVARALGVLGAVAAATTGIIGGYHVGVEQKWWDGPSSCTGGGAGLAGLSGESLLDPTAAGVLVMCDEVAWSLAGISMPGWNMIFSLGLAALWAVAAWRAPSRT